MSIISVQESSIIVVLTVSWQMFSRMLSRAYMVLFSFGTSSGWLDSSQIRNSCHASRINASYQFMETYRTVVLLAFQDLVHGTLSYYTSLYCQITKPCIPNHLSDTRHDITDGIIPIINTILPYVSGCFQPISVALAKSAWSNTTAMCSRWKDDMISKVLRSISCTVDIAVAGAFMVG